MKTIIVVAMVIILTGCALWRPAAPPEQPPNEDPGQDFTRVKFENLPEPVQIWAENAKSMHLAHALVYEGKRYVSVGYGEKPTGGYSVSIENVVVADGEITVITNFFQPEPGQSVTEVITYPMDIVYITDLTRPLEYAAAGDEEYVPQLMGLEQLPDIVAQSYWIKVFEPAPNSETGRTIDVRGVASVYEGTLQWRLKQENLVLIEGFTTAGMGDWYLYEFEVSVPANVENQVSLELYTISADDGREQNLVTLPLNISTD